VGRVMQKVVMARMRHDDGDSRIVAANPVHFA
jgi:flagellar biosynthesis protein FlhB